MFKYEMIINNEKYNALFEDHMVAADFIDDIAQESELIVLGFHEVTIEEILADTDFCYSYKIEMIGAIVFPDTRFHKVSEIESALTELGII